jgi:hypothetical protein
MLEASLKITLFFNKQTYILGQLSTFAPNTLSNLAFQSFDFERTWWSLFQKSVVRTKFDTYVFFNKL